MNDGLRRVGLSGPSHYTFFRPPTRFLEAVRSTVPLNMAATLNPAAESLADWGDSDGDAAYVDRPTVRSLYRHIPPPPPLTGVIAEATPC
jgi:hypothetical protein